MQKVNDSCTKSPMVGGDLPFCKKDVLQIVEKNATEILKVLELSGFDSNGYKLTPSIEHHLKSIEAMQWDWLGFYKYKLAAFDATVKNSTIPKMPDHLPSEDDPEVLLGGKALMWLRLIKRTNPERYNEIAASMRTVKRSCERPCKAYLKRAEREAFTALTTTRNEVRTTESQSNLRELKEKAINIVQEIFEGEDFTFRNNLKPFFPSTNANYITTRKSGGAVGHLMRGKLMRKLRCQEKLISAKLVRKGRHSTRVHVDDGPLLEKWRQLFEGIIDEAIKETKSVKLVALAEALKVRVISKGPVNTYTVLKPLQQWMWRTLKNHKSGVFKLIGQEIDADYLEQQVGPLRDDESYLSGDYKAATDNLNPEISNAIVQEISKYIDDVRIRDLFKESLTGHLIENPDNPKDLRPQKWGQLMGSIVSFPILCIANAAICTLAREKSIQQEGKLPRELLLRNTKISVNGDDCVFRATEAGVKAWEFWAKVSGMSPSVGKYFVSKEFLNMNSAEFKVRSPECVPSELKVAFVKPVFKVKDGVVKLGGPEDKNLETELIIPPLRFLTLVKRINMGLAAGLGRSTSGKMEACRVNNWGGINSIAINSNTLINECAEEDRVRLFKYYLNNNWTVLKSTRLSWFLPEHLGGIGLPTFPQHFVEKDGKSIRPWMPTNLDLRIASAMFKHAKKIPKRPEGVAWKVWDYATRRTNEIFNGIDKMYFASTFNEMQVKSDDFGQENLRKEVLTSRFCVEAIFRLPFTKVYRETREENLTLRKMEAEVDRIKRNFLQDVEPFDENHLANKVIESDITQSGFISNPVSAEYNAYFPAEMFFSQ